MLKSIYTPVSGAIAQERVLEVISNNLANMNTVGFKGDNVTFEQLLPEPEKRYTDPLPPANYKVDLEKLSPLHGNEVAYVGISGIHRDTTQGPAITTHSNTDLMIEGEGLFSVQTPDGVRYTRNGAFELNPDGVLTTKAGHPVMGTKGNIFLRSGQFEVNARGEIYQDGEMVDRLQLYQAADQTNLERVGDNYYIYGGAPQDLTLQTNPSIRQGYLEGSNVNAIKSLTAMILAHRSFEAYQKAVSNYDQIMEKTSNSIGDVRT